jgi:hypothetical protein
MCFAQVNKDVLETKACLLRCSEGRMAREKTSKARNSGEVCIEVDIYNRLAHGYTSATTGVREEHNFNLGSDIQSYVVRFSFGRGPVVPSMPRKSWGN